MFSTLLRKTGAASQDEMKLGRKYQEQYKTIETFSLTADILTRADVDVVINLTIGE